MKGQLIGLLVPLLQLAAVNAAPVLESRSISSDLLAQLNLYEQWSAAAYGASNDDNPNPAAISCAAKNCPLVEDSAPQSVTEFNNQGKVDATGFVAVDPKRKQIVVSYRGSHSVKNFIADGEFFQSDFLCDGCKVHDGFLDSWLATQDQVIKAVQSAQSANPGFSLFVTGHSLGAAIATLAAAELRSKGMTVGLFNYGSPMVGNDAFATFVTNQPGGNFRVTHASDVVPKVPGYEILNYRHIAPEFFITSKNGVTPTADDIQMINVGTLDKAGNEGTLIPSVADHLFYFNAISADGKVDV